MSPSVAWIVTPLSSPAVLSISASLLLHTRGGALLLVFAQLFLRAEFFAAVIALEHFHGSPSLLRLRSRTVVLQRQLDRHAVTLLHVLQRRRREVQQHPALSGLHEEPSLLRAHAG